MTERGALPRAASFLGWRMVLIAGIGVFLVGPAQTYGVSVFVDPMLDEFGWSRGLISTAYAAATLIGAGAVMVFGRLLDRFGHRVVLTGAAIGFGGALLAMSVVDGPLTLTLGYALLRGFGIGGLLLASRTLAAQWFERRRGRALSLVALGGSLSLALVPLASDLLIEHVGWRAAWRIDALVIWLVLLPTVALFVRGRPEDVGQHPDGVLTMATEDAASTGGPLDLAWEPYQAIRTRAFWLLLFASMVPGLIVTGLDFNQISILTGRGLSSTAAASVFTISSILALLAGLAGGWLVDRFPPRYVLAIGQVALATSMLVIVAASATGLALLYGVVRGIALGTWAVAIDATWPAYYGRGRLGSIRGMTFAAEIVGAALGPIPFGIIYDALGGYDVAILGLLVLPVAATAAVLLATPPRPTGELSAAL
ncbi:MAG: transporter [Thermomicrobiales bacterium]|nr:transporter [Thermomicrobiales bacterium]